jgi:hypothetical protein
MRGKGRRRRAWQTSEGGEAAERLAFFVGLVRALLGGTRRPLPAHLVAALARYPSADRASARRRVATIAQLVKKMGIDLGLRQAALGGVWKHHAAAFAPRLCVPPAAIFAALVCELFGGTADGHARDLAADRARVIGADCASVR